MTLIVIAGSVAVPTLACAENPPAAIDSYVAAFMASISEQTSVVELRESNTTLTMAWSTRARGN
jgi:hypothetical protein